ncbi:MAG TPA: chemotaxis protein CheA [Polyangiales bacterium]
MKQLFVEEAAELLTDFEQALLLLESLPDDVELLNRIFRCAHTVKGNAKLLGIEVVASFTHQLENLLDKLRKQELVVTQGVANTLFASLDVLKGLLAELAGGPPHDGAAYASTEQRIAALVADLAPARGPALELPPLELPPLELPSPAPPVPEPVAMTAPHVPSVPTPPAPPPRYEAPPARLEADAHNTADSAGDLDGANRKSNKERRNADGEANSVRVSVDKLDRLINLTGEVVIAQSMISQLVDDLTPARVDALRELVAQMERHCRELQERMLGARMLPIKNVFARFQRLARDLGAQTGKVIALEVSGEETELDKTVIEKIGDPLTHLVRNAIDHGIETPAERIAAGKPEQARLKLAAYQKGGSIFIDVSDDGRGLNRDKILAKARKVGLVGAETELRDEQIHELIFHAGFSTAEQVTEISGRGVGMDVVRRNVQALKGSISILTEPGRGTTFRVKLPLTLAILDGLGIRVGEQVYLVPLVAVVESLKPRAQDVHRLSDRAYVVDVRGEYLHLVRLFELFGLEPTHHAPDQGLLMVLDDGVQKFALQIDELLGQFQVVIKSLEANYRAVPGISGATVLGDGRVALILDTSNLANLARTSAQPTHLERASSPLAFAASTNGSRL